MNEGASKRDELTPISSLEGQSLANTTLCVTEAFSLVTANGSRDVKSFHRGDTIRPLWSANDGDGSRMMWFCNVRQQGMAEIRLYFKDGDLRQSGLMLDRRVGVPMEKMDYDRADDLLNNGNVRRSDLFGIVGTVVALMRAAHKVVMKKSLAQSGKQRDDEHDESFDDGRSV